MKNFIHVALCDNDFGQHLENAVRYVFENYPEKNESSFKDSVVLLTAAFASIRRPEDFGVDRDYLNNNISVTFSDTVPDCDHDGGSVAVARSTNYIWRY